MVNNTNARTIIIDFIFINEELTNFNPSKEIQIKYLDFNTVQCVIVG